MERERIMGYIEFMKLVKERRSIRRFKQDPVPLESVEKIVEAARWAMSGGNAQPWDFIAIQNKETKEKIIEIYQSQQMEMHFLEMARQQELRHPQLAQAPSGPPGFADAPLIIAVLGDPRVQHTVSILGASSSSTRFELLDQSLGCSVQIMQLAVTSLGLTSGWVSIVHPMIEEPLKQLLGVPNVLRLMVLVPVGYPAHQPRTPFRREITEFLHYERYDMTRFRSGKDIIDYVKKN